jgi:hypothetical protein
MNYEQFKSMVEAAGLTPRQCNPEHFQIRGGKFIVNFYPNTKRGQRFYVNCTAHGATGSLGDAITAATGEFSIQPNAAKRPSQGKTKRIKKRLMKKNPVCCYCGIKITPQIASLDHYIPRIKGGGDFDANYRLCCLNCNANKGGSLPIDQHSESQYLQSIGISDVGEFEFPETRTT